MRCPALPRRVADFRLEELAGWSFRLTVDPHGSRLDGVYPAAAGGTLRARVTGLDACPDQPSFGLRLDGPHSIQFTTTGIGDPDEAVDAVHALLSAFSGGELSAVRESSRLQPIAAPARVRGC